MKGWKGPRRPCQISACVMSCNELLCWVPLCPFFFCALATLRKLCFVSDMHS